MSSSPARARMRAGLLACCLLASSAHAAADLGAALSDSDLESVRGREGLQLPAVQISENHMNATISGNNLAGTTTGANLAGQSVFSGASGIATLIQNSGNQVVIQNNVIINLTVK